MRVPVTTMPHVCPECLMFLLISPNARLFSILLSAKASYSLCYDLMIALLYFIMFVF